MGVMDRYNAKKKKESEVDNSAFNGGVAERYERNKYYQTLDLDSVNDDYIEAFFSDTNAFFESVNGGKSSFTDATSRLADLNKRRDTIEGWLYKNKSHLPENSYRSILDTVSSAGETFKNLTKHYSRFKSEDDYVMGYGYTDDNYYTAYTKNVDDRLAEIEEAKASGKADQSLEDEQKRLLAKKKQLQYKREGYERSAVGDPKSNFYDPEFDKYAEIGKQYYEDTHYNSEEATSTVPSYNFDQKGVAPPKEYTEWKDKLYSFEYANMEDDERDIYHYWLGKATEEAGGGEIDESTAERYVELITEDINARRGQKMAKDINDQGKLMQMAFSVYSGLESYGTGIKNALSSEDEYIPQTATAVASQGVREDMHEDGALWGVAYDVANTSANNAPSLALSFIPYAGTALYLGSMGLSSAGHAYADAINQGYNAKDARLYSTAVGATEVGLSYLLDGVIKGGGKLSNAAIGKLTSKVKNAAVKAVFNFAGKSGSEFIEENLQEGLFDPVWSNVFLKTDKDVDLLSEEALYSGLLGALSAAGHNAVGSAVNATAKYSDAKATYGDAESLQGLIDEGLESPTSKGLAEKVQSKVNDGKKVSGRSIYNLAQANEKAIRSEDIDTMKKAVTERLTALGESGDVATVADVIVKQASGDTLTKSEQAVIESSKYGIRVSNEVSPDNVGTGEYSNTWAGDIGTSRINFEAYNHNELMALAEERAGVKKSEPSAIEYGLNRQNSVVSDEAEVTKADSSVDKKITTVDDLSLSEDGVTRVASTGEVVTIDKSNPIAKTKMVDGKEVVYFNTDKGEVESSDITYANENDGLLHESFVDMSPAIANAAIKAYDGTTPAKTYVNGMREGILIYGRHNFKGVGVDISADSHLASLSDADQKLALELGRKLAEIETNRGDEALKSAIRTAAQNVKKTSNGKPVVKGAVTFEKGVKPKSEKQKASVAFAEKLAEVTGIRIVFYDSKINPKHEYADADGASNANTIWLDMSNSHNDAVAYTLSHEFVHFAKKWSKREFKVFADFMVEQFAAHDKSLEELVEMKMGEIGTDDWDYAFEEVVCDACERMLMDSNAMEKLAALKKKDPGVFEKFIQHIKDLLAKLRAVMAGTEYTNEYSKELYEMEDVLDRFLELFENMAVDAVQNFQEASLLGLDENTDIFAVEDTTKYSYKSLAEAAGFEAVESEDGKRAFMRNGKKVSKVTKDDIEISSIGALINFSLDKGDIDEEHADRQKQMFADICTMACKTNDFAMTMQFVGSAVFTGMKANADAQYGTTYDFPSICTKTQAVIDAMSAKMVKLGRGLSNDEILDIYQEVFDSGNPVPCPECYVFSRWIGIGGLLDNIKSYQDYYGKMKPTEVAAIYEEMKSEVKTFADEMGITYGKAKGALTSKLTKEFNKLTEKIEKAENQGEWVSEKDRKRLAEIEPKMKTVKAMTWIEKVYFEGSSLTKVRENFAVPNEILFDLNRGEEFAAQYPEAWAFRTTQGAGYGKAITPYADAVLGEGIHATQNLSNTIKGKANGNLNNLFLQQRGMLDSKAKKVLEGARAKQKVQAFLGGQRFQSTSDARYENASDYLIAALEMQAMQGMVQVYTKVDGAVPAFSTWGFSINQSLMPLGGGIDAKGNIKDTSVGGMNPNVAFKNRENHESAGTITIGVNDRHIRALIAKAERDFVIPYHASGGKANLIAEFRRVQDKQASKGTFVRSSDYSKTQSDKVLSDTVLEWMGKTAEEIEQIHKVREARIAILTRGNPNMEVVRGNRFLSALYDKLNGGEWDGVKIAKGKIEHQIFPNEFWDQSVTYENSKKITEDYLEYCEDLGFLHRFSGLTPSNGMLIPVMGYDENGNRVQLTDLAYKYDENGKKTAEVEDFFWKVITDRRMYDNDGNYLPQKRVVLNDTTTNTVTSFAKNNAGREYNKELSLKTAERIANGGIKIPKIRIDLGIANAIKIEGNEAIVEGMTDIFNMAEVKKQKKKTETHSAIGKEILQYAEGNQQPDLTLVEIVNERTGKKEKTITHYGDKPKGYIPKKIAYCYKLFEQHPDGSLHALFAGAGDGQPIGEWIYAQGFPYTDSGVKGMNLRERYGWHLSAGLPSAPHLMSPKSFERGYPSKKAYGHPKDSKRVWVRMAYDATNDYNSIADSTVGKVGKGDIFGLIPFGGYYSFKENNQSEWVISSGVKIDKVLSEEERQQILKEAGYDEYEAWRLKHQATAEEKAEREALQKRPQKVKDAEFTASALAMREKIKSRIIDNPELSKGTKFQKKKTSYAPTFYSKMERVIGEIKLLKMGTGGVVPYLKGKGVKNEEIKWSGIEVFLEGKKSVTKEELQEFVAGNQLVVEEEMSGETLYVDNEAEETYTEAEFKERAYEIADDYGYGRDNVTFEELFGGLVAYVGRHIEENEILFAEKESGGRWEQYKLDGGSNYRELVFKLPNSTYNNRAMRVHWGEDAEGVLVHARIQDFDVNGKKMLFVEELQSDWHNEGHAKGYTTNEYEDAVAVYDRLAKDYHAKRMAFNKYVRSGEFRSDPDEVSKKKFDWLRSKMDTAEKRMHDAERDVEALKEKGMGDVPDAPFRDTYHEYVMKRLLRMAAEEGYDSIGWTPSEIQVDRWSEEFAEGYRIEYDQDIPKFLRKYGKKWGATVGSTTLSNGTEVWSMDIPDSMKESVLYEGKVKFSKKTEASARHLLSNALESVAQSDIERNKLAQYKEKIDLLNEEEAKLQELNDELRKLSFPEKGTKRDRKRINDLRFEVKHTTSRINTLDKMLLDLEASAPLKKVLQREKDAIMRAYKKKGREMSRSAVRKKTESISKKIAKKDLEKLVLDTARWLRNPTKDEVKCPDVLRVPFAEFLDSIDMSSKRLLQGGSPTQNDLRIASAMDSLATAVERIKKAQDPSSESSSDGIDAGYLDLPANFVENIRLMSESIKRLMNITDTGYDILQEMSSEEMKTLIHVIKVLKKGIRDMQRLYTNYRFANAVTLGQNTMTFVDALGEDSGKALGFREFYVWQNAVPYYAFKRFGDAGESIFESFMDAQDKQAFLSDVILKFAEKTWTTKEVKAWSEDVHDILLPSGANLTLTTADAMNLYCLARRQHAGGHLAGYGVRVKGIKKGGKKLSDSLAVFSEEDVNEIIKTNGKVLKLTDRQVEVAEDMQKFMSTTCAEWGNEISMKRFLTKMFNEEYYVPIQSDPLGLDTKDPEAQKSDLFRLLNISATKPLTEGANNRIIVRNLFDVFTEHATDMARLNAWGMALLDYMKWMNYREKHQLPTGKLEQVGVRQSIETSYGDVATRYLLNLVKDVNGVGDGGRKVGFVEKTFSHAKTAAVGANLRVAALQFTAYPRASVVLSNKSLVKGAAKLKPSIAKAKKYCGIALWKSFGYYDTDVSRTMEAQIKGDTSVIDKVKDASMWLAGKADEITWGYLWNACEAEVAATGKYKVGTEEFNIAVGKKLREVVYSSQVVDSVLTRSELMRSKNSFAKMASSFMSEHTMTHNITLDCMMKFSIAKRQTGSTKTALAKTWKHTARSISTIMSTTLLVALVGGLYAALRDDDDEPFEDKYSEAFIGSLLEELIPMSRLPIASDITGLIASKFGVGYFSSSNMTTDYLATISNAYDAWVDIFNNGEDAQKTVYYALYNTMKGISQLTGVPGSNAMREVVSLWNSTVGSADYSMKIRTYEPSDSANAENLYQAIESGDTEWQKKMENLWVDETERQKALKTVIGKHYTEGDVDLDTAERYLKEYCGMEDDDIHWQLDRWQYTAENGSSDGYSKYEDFFAAVESGKNLKAVIQEYTANGVDNKTLASQITSHFKPIYREMSNYERANLKGYLLNAYSILGYDRSKKSKDIDKWLED